MANRLSLRGGPTEDVAGRHRQDPAIRRIPGLGRFPGLRQQLSDPLAANGYALIANSGATGALGLVYWLLMARIYPAADVGRASAVYAAMNLLAGFTALNFNGALTRFIPQAGDQTRSMVVRSYLVSGLSSVVVSVVFLLTLHWWGSSYSDLDGKIAGGVFVACVVAWAVFTLQDSVLVGLRSAFWVLVENGLFGVVKIVLLVLLATALPHHLGIYASWMLPVFVAVPLVNGLIFGRLVPRHTELTRHYGAPSNRQIGRFLAGDYAGAMCLLATVSLLPVVVAARTDAASTAYFYIAWVIAGIVDMIGISMGMSLTVEGSFDAAALAVNCRKALRKISWMLLPCALLFGLLAPEVLRLFGRGYAAHGAPVLELLAAATLPRAATELYLGVLRARSQTTLVAVIQAARAVLMLGLAVVLTGKVGTVGAGIAALASQAVIAVAIGPGLWRALTGKQSYTRGQSHTAGVDPVTTQAPPRPQRATRRRIAWWPQATIALVAAAGLALFFGSLHGIHLAKMSGLGLLSVLPPGVLAGVLVLSVAFILGLRLARPQPVVLGAILAGLVVCLDGITAFAEPEPRFPTAYQIAGYVDYVAKTGHTAPGLAAYFSWAGFFALVAFVAGAAGTHGLLDLMRVWPMGIDLLCLPPLFMIMRNLKISWRAAWLAGFIFVVGNWVGQDYFSPQSYGLLLYLVFVAILVNWFITTKSAEPWPDGPRWMRWLHWPRWLGRTDRFFFDVTQPGERSARPAGPGLKAFLIVLLIALFAVITASHQLTPFFMIAAALGLVITRRSTLTTLPVLTIVILLGWVSFETVGYWSGHIRDIFGGFGNLGFNVTSSVGGRLEGSTPTHLLALHARVGVAGVVILLAGLGLLRRRLNGFDDRVLFTLLCVPIALIAVQSYGGEIALRIYLFLLPAAAVLAACLFFPREDSPRPGWRALPLLLVGALVLPVGFFLARYGNEAFEQTPAGELAATNWVYAHDGTAGVRLLWLSTDPVTDVTPEMPWSYQDLPKVVYVPAQAPRDPAQVSGLISALRSDGPNAYLIATRTQVAAMQQTASYPTDWGPRFSAAMAAAPEVRVAYTTSDAAVYALRWSAGSKPYPLGVSLPSPAQPGTHWDVAELVLMWVLLAVLAAREFGRMRGAGPRLIRLLTVSAVPLLLVFGCVVVIRFVLLS